MADLRMKIPPHYFNKINFTDDEIELLVWHFGNQKMQNKDEGNSDAIFWNQVRFFKGFVHDFLNDDEEFWWDENMCDAVRIFNSFNNQFLGQLFYEKNISDDFADKAAIASWFYLVYEYAKISGLDEQAKNSFSEYKKILLQYFQANSDGAQNIIEYGVKDARRYINEVKRLSELDGNRPNHPWSKYKQSRHDVDQKELNQLLDAFNKVPVKDFGESQNSHYKEQSVVSNEPLVKLRETKKSISIADAVGTSENSQTAMDVDIDLSIPKQKLHKYSDQELTQAMTAMFDPKSSGNSNRPKKTSQNLLWFWLLASATVIFVVALLFIQISPKEANINDLATLEQPAALNGVVDKNSVVSTALIQVFGKSGVNGVLKENSNELSSLFVQAPFFHNEKEHLVVFIKTQALDEKTGNPIECHACSVKLSAVVFNKEGGSWVYLSKAKFFTDFGSWGDAVLNDPIKIEQNFSKNSTAFLIVSGWSGQGYTDEFTTIITYRDNKWQDLGSINTGSDNQGACDESEQAKSTGDFKACWQNKGSLTVVRSKDLGYPDIIVMRSGTKSTKNNEVVTARGATYHFKKTKYSSDENSVE